MKKSCLLDTQAFVLAAREQGTLPKRAREAFLDEANILYLSVASVWEAQIKIGLGKLRLPVPLPEAVRIAVSEIGIRILPIQLEHLYELGGLPVHHKDPFDRLLISQARVEKLQVIGGDEAFDAYGVKRIW